MRLFFFCQEYEALNERAQRLSAFNSAHNCQLDFIVSGLAFIFDLFLKSGTKIINILNGSSKEKLEVTESLGLDV